MPGILKAIATVFNFVTGSFGINVAILLVSLLILGVLFYYFNKLFNNHFKHLEAKIDVNQKETTGKINTVRKLLNRYNKKLDIHVAVSEDRDKRSKKWK